jgi:enoyl-CoA hydratase
MSLVSYEQQGDVALITMDDGKANAMNETMIEAVHAALDQAQRDAKSVLITGRPGLLSGGFDLAVIRSGDAEAAKSMVTAGGRLLMRLYGLPKPLVMVTSGHGVALGAFLLLTADYRFGAIGDFKIGLNEVAIGMTLPPFALMLTNARIAPQHISNSAINATMYTPEQAVGPGFLDEVVDSRQLMAQALEKAQALAALDGPAFVSTKQDLRGADIKRVMATL